MTNRERIETNNTRIEEAIAIAEGLPESGGGGGATIDTCTVNLVTSFMVTPETVYMGLDGGNPVAQYMPAQGSYTIDGVLSNSFMVLNDVGSPETIQVTYSNGFVEPEVVGESIVIIWLYDCTGEVTITI